MGQRGIREGGTPIKVTRPPCGWDSNPRPLDLKPHRVFREEAAGSGGSNMGLGARQADGG